MDEVFLTAEQEAEAERIEDNLRAAATVEIRRISRLLAIGLERKSGTVRRNRVSSSRCRPSDCSTRNGCRSHRAKKKRYQGSSVSCPHCREDAKFVGYRECRMPWVGLVFNPQSAGQTPRQRIWESRYVAGLMSLDAIGQQLRAECRSVGVSQAAVVIGLQNGGLSAVEGIGDALARRGHHRPVPTPCSLQKRTQTLAKLLEPNSLLLITYFSDAHPPERLTVDTYDGSAWVGIVAFHMDGVRPWWSPPFPGVSSFHETNVRTYVHLDGKHPGIWFFTLDASSSLAVRLARWRWHLAYPLREATLMECQQTLLPAAGIKPHGDVEHVLYSQGVDVSVFGLRPV